MADDRALIRTWLWFEQNAVGEPGVRDRENPCRDFAPGFYDVLADCMTDGHYACWECRHMAKEAREARGEP